MLEVYGEVSCRGYAYAYANRRRHTLELVQKVSKPGATILDVAAAQGNFSLALAELGYNVTWNDLREELVDYVKLKHEQGTIHFATGNIFALDLPQFDLVLITEVIEHVAHPDQFLRRVAELTKPGGYVVMTTPNGEYFRNRLPKFSECTDPSMFDSIQFGPDAEDHIFLLHLDEVHLLAQKAGLSIIETRLFTNSLTNGHIKLEPLLKLLPRTGVNALEMFSGLLPLAIQRRIHTSMASLLARTT